MKIEEFIMEFENLELGDNWTAFRTELHRLLIKYELTPVRMQTCFKAEPDEDTHDLMPWIDIMRPH